MGNPWLIIAAVLSGTAALAHVGCIVFGAPWYRFFGAGEKMARMAEAGSPVPGVVTAGIAVVLAAWAAYALSGAGLLPRLPLLRLVLVAITGVYLLRGIAGLVLAAVAPGERSVEFWCWSSLICLAIATVHIVGLRKVWPSLSLPS